MWLRFVL